MSNGTTFADRPARFSKSRTTAADREQKLIKERRGLLIRLLSDGIEGSPSELVCTLCALLGTELAALPGRDVDAEISACHDDLDEVMRRLEAIVDGRPDLLDGKSLGEMIQVVRHTREWRGDALKRK